MEADLDAAFATELPGPDRERLRDLLVHQWGGIRNQTHFSQLGAPTRSIFRSRSEPGKAMNGGIGSIETDESYTEAGVGVISSEMYEALLLADVPKEKARAAAAEVAKGQDLASKFDLFELGAQLRSEMDKRFGEIEKSLALLKFAVFSGGAIILVLLIKLVFIP